MNGRHASNDDDRPLIVHLGFGGIGGIAAVCRTLSDGLEAFGYRSAMVRHGTAAELDAGTKSWDGLEVVASLQRKGRLNLGVLVSCCTIVRRQRPNVVIAHDHSLIPAAFLGFLLGRRRPRIVMVEHQPIGLRTRGTNLRSLIGLVFASALVCLSDDYAQRYPYRALPLRSVRRMRVIPNAVDTSYFSPSSEPRSNPGGWTVGMASRFIPTKDIRTLISAIALLNAADPQHRYKLELAGDGPDEASLAAHAASCGASPDVTFLGRLDERGLLDFYRRLDTYVQATLGETMSTSILQALACGVPVVASNVEGIGNLLSDRTNARLTPVGDPEALAEVLRDLSENPQMASRFRAVGRDLVIDRFAMSATAGQYAQLFDRIGAT